MKYLMILLLLFGCTKKEEKPKEVLEMESKIKKLEEEFAKYDEKIKKAAGNPGLEIRLNQDRELAKARVERMRLQYEQKTGTTFRAPAKEAEGGGHGGGH